MSGIPGIAQNGYDEATRHTDILPAFPCRSGPHLGDTWRLGFFPKRFGAQDAKG